MRSLLAAYAGCVLLLSCAAARAQADGPGSAVSPGTTLERMTLTEEERRHATDEWKTIESHLPDPKTAPPQQLEMVADVLRARKFPNEALQYYQHALTRGGKPVTLLNKIGVTQMELQLIPLALASFKRATQLNPKDPEGWNNLASIEYLRGQYGSAVNDYKKAIKLDKKSASFHSNLATAYFGEKEFDRARKEYETAIRLDPHVFEYHGSGGLRTQMQSPTDRGRYCYEMARLAAGQGSEENVLHWLGKAAETSFDILEEMRGDKLLSKYRKDPRVIAMVKTAKDLHSDRPIRSGDQLPALPTSQPF